jgi:hypothetical protein
LLSGVFCFGIDGSALSLTAMPGRAIYKKKGDHHEGDRPGISITVKADLKKPEQVLQINQ